MHNAVIPHRYLIHEDDAFEVVDVPKSGLIHGKPIDGYLLLASFGVLYSKSLRPSMGKSQLVYVTGDPGVRRIKAKCEVAEVANVFHPRDMMGAQAEHEESTHDVELLSREN